MTETRTNDGGPAFPFYVADYTRPSDGMSLRDYFAAKAMQGFLAGWDAHEKTFPTGNFGPLVANAAYYVADSMIAERDKGGAE